MRYRSGTNRFIMDAILCLQSMLVKSGTYAGCGTELCMRLAEWRLQVCPDPRIFLLHPGQAGAAASGRDVPLRLSAGLVARLQPGGTQHPAVGHTCACSDRCKCHAQDQWRCRQERRYNDTLDFCQRVPYLGHPQPEPVRGAFECVAEPRCYHTLINSLSVAVSTYAASAVCPCR